MLIIIMQAQSNSTALSKYCVTDEFARRAAAFTYTYTARRRLAARHTGHTAKHERDPSTGQYGHRSSANRLICRTNKIVYCIAD